MTAIEALTKLLEVQKNGPQMTGDFGRGLDAGIVIGLESAIMLESGVYA